MKRIFTTLVLFCCIAGSGTASARRQLGTAIVAYGIPGKSAITFYYVYGVYGDNMIEREKLEAGLKKGTADLEWKRTEFYLGQREDVSVPAFKETLSKKELKRAKSAHGGYCDEEGSGKDLLTPQRPARPDRGIQHSTADMSEFTNNARLGTISIYYGSGGAISSAYIWDLRGKSLDDKAGVAAILASKISGSGYIGFEHRPGDCNNAQSAIREKAGNSVSTRCQGEYKVN